MSCIFRLIFGVYFLFMIFLIIGNWKGYITYGYGLGDLFYLILAVIALLITSVLAFHVFIKRRRLMLFLMFLIFSIVIFFGLNATIYRGSEYKWNGQIFRVIK